MKTLLPYAINYNWIADGENCIAFCYLNDESGFALRGRRDLVLAHVENMGQIFPMVCFNLSYGKDKWEVPKINVYGLKKGISVSFFGTRINPGTKLREKHHRNWIVVYDNKVVVYVKRVRQFHRGWMKELDPFVKGSKVSIPLIHDGNKQNQSKISHSSGIPQFQQKVPIISHHKGAFRKPIHIPTNMNAKKFMPKSVVIPNQMTDFLETIEKEKRKVEMEAKNAMIRKHRDHMLKHLRKMGVIPGVKGEPIDIFEVKEEIS